MKGLNTAVGAVCSEQEWKEKRQQTRIKEWMETQLQQGLSVLQKTG